MKAENSQLKQADEEIINNYKFGISTTTVYRNHPKFEEKDRSFCPREELVNQTGLHHTLRTAHGSFNQPCLSVWVLVYAAKGQMAIEFSAMELHADVVLMTRTIIRMDSFSAAGSQSMSAFSGSILVTF